MTATSAGLSGIGTADLERLCVELSRLAPGVAVSHAMLAGLRLGQLWEVVHVLGVLDAKSLRSLVGAVLSERAARPATHVELVWTGGEGKTAYARPTASVIRELFSSAEHHVLLAGYSFDHGRDIFAPL
ncbi:MAG TPA: phospholipase, partial [Polyangiaceae bacterium]|nr:phospholipase [Polyangiaceae bacterium]